MDKNNKNDSFILSEEIYNDYINKTIDKLKKYLDIYLIGKLLNYLEKPTLYYYCTVYSNTKYNPFDINIEFSIEFIEDEIPYVTILTDFIEPTLNDNRNYYRCLCKDFKYKFSFKNLNKHEIALESMIQGIENFLTYLNESIAVNSFIIFGQYEYEHIYQINDFLQTKNYLNFYRINELKDGKLEERYIIITKLFFIFFIPTPEDKALVKILFYEKLKDMSFDFDKNEHKHTLILRVNHKRYKNEIEFFIIDRKRKFNNEELNLVEEDENTNKIIGKKNNWDYSILIKEWFSYQDNIDFKKYDLVLNNYKILFKDIKRKFKVNVLNKEKINEYNKFIQFNEKLIDLYRKLKNNNNKERIQKFIANIIYICSELVDYANTENGKENEYLIKIRKYIVENK